MDIKIKVILILMAIIIAIIVTALVTYKQTRLENTYQTQLKYMAKNMIDELL